MKISGRYWCGAVTAIMLLVIPFVAMAAPKKEPPFSYSTVLAQAQELAGRDYVKPASLDDDWLSALNYDTYREVIFKNDQSYWRGTRLPFQMQFFHLGSLYLTPVELYEVIDGKAKAISFDPANFLYSKTTPPADAAKRGWSYPGFKLTYPLNRADKWDEVLVFLGASYFRSLGKDQHYGLSARGLAVDTASARGEEFPDFRKFWIQRPGRWDKEVRIYALLDSPSVTGAYEFTVRPGENVVMNVKAKLFAREDIEKLGLAPLTSMYVHGENNNRLQQDFRPEVHDSDGLLMKNGNGEWLWRPLNNPATLAVSSFSLEGIGGFGLMQRDRSFASYQDLEADYESRPSLWIEPKGNWGKGSVQLVEIPTDSEIHDNIVAYWVPAERLKAGKSLSVEYRLNWGNASVAGTRPLEVSSTHVGQQFSSDKVKFVVDFAPAANAKPTRVPQPVAELWNSSGQLSPAVVMPNPHTGGWRVVFDLTPEGDAVYELRASLRQGKKAISETWTYQWRKEK